MEGEGLTRASDAVAEGPSTPTPPAASSGRYLAAVLLGAGGVAVRTWRQGGADLGPLVSVGLSLLVVLALQPPGRLRNPIIRVPLLLLVAASPVAAYQGGRLLPVGAVLLTSVLATGAVLRWRPLPGWPERPTPVAPLAVGPIIVADISWVRTASVPVLIGCALATVALLELSARAPRLVHAIDDRLARASLAVAHGLSWLLASLAWLLIVLPLWALGRLTRYSPLDLGWATRDSAWLTLGSQRDGSHRNADARHLGAPEIAPTRKVKWQSRLRAIPIVAVVLLLLAPTIDDRVLNRDTGSSQQAAIIDLRSGANASGPLIGADPEDGPVTWNGTVIDEATFGKAPWSRRLFAELNSYGTTKDRILGTRLVDHRGRYFNIEDGLRVSYEAEDPKLTVWFFGGSTMIGIGQRDGYTIPSAVGRIAEEDGIPLEVRNFGVSGDVSWQEVLRFAEALEGREAPDVVVFYDGWNDVSLGYVTAVNPKAQLDIPRRLPITEAEQKEDGVVAGQTIGPQDSRRAATLAAHAYDRSMGTAQALADANGVQLLSFWQPILHTKAPSPVEDVLNDRLGLKRQGHEDEAAVYRSSRDQTATDPIDLTQVMDQATAPVYFDQGHTNELGARLVAEAMYEHLRPVLRQELDATD